MSHLLALVVVVAAVALSVGGYVTVQGYNDARRRASAQLREAVDLAARAVRQDLENLAAQTATLAPSLAPAFAAAAGAGVPLSQVCELTFAPLPVFPAGEQHLLDAGGAVSCTSQRPALGTAYGGEPWFAALGGGGPVTAYMDRDPSTGQPAVAVAGDGGQPVGYVLSVLAVRPVAGALAEVYGGPAGYAFIVVDGAGREVSSSAAPASERIYSASKVAAPGWRILGGVTESAALAPARSERGRQVLALVVSLGALLLLALAVHRRLLRPVRDLSRVMTRARDEQGVRAPPGGPAELAGLAGDLNAMLEARDGYETHLAELADALADSGRLLVEAREQERQRVGVHLHDGPIQDMILAGWALDDLAAQLPVDASAEVRRRLEAAVAAARSIEADLRPPKLVDGGLSDAIVELVGRLRDDSPFAIEVDDRLAGTRFPSHTELLIYRCVQEALQNARKHSRATRVRVVLGWDGGVVTAAVSDDGVGVDDDLLAQRAAGGHYGVVSMRDSVTLAGGRFSIGLAAEGGAEVRVEVPATPWETDGL
ncbi:MAG TPA: ATP-binding protein, partial [Acidimicrobiia bacterium]